MGSLDHPFNPVSLALGAEASFVGRALDSDRKQLTEVLRAAAEHRGSALVEIYQNCPIFNDRGMTGGAERVVLRQGEPIRAGDKVLRRNANGGLAFAADGEPIIHDAGIADPSQAFALSRVDAVLTGVFRDVRRDVYDDLVRAQITNTGRLSALLRGGSSWRV
jgi:2-oxoglutarate ferredoxin oxidoreductase subunit beta